MKIVFLDAATVGKDVSLDGLRQFGETVFYDATKQGEAASRVADCDIVITNKVKVYRDEIDAARLRGGHRSQLRGRGLRCL